MSSECDEAFDLWFAALPEDALEYPATLAEMAFRAGWDAKPTDYGEVGDDL